MNTHFLAAFYVSYLRKNLPDYALKHLTPAFEGDEDNAFRLIAAAPNSLRGIIAVVAYHSDVPNPAYRTLVELVWNHDHDQLLRVVQSNRPVIHKILAKADCDLSCLPQSFTIWRGVSGVAAKKAAKGLSWTTDRDTACFFACRLPSPKRYPVVLRADVRRRDIVFATNSRDENEVIPRTGITWMIDDNNADWMQGFERFEKANWARNAALLSRYSADS